MISRFFSWFKHEPSANLINDSTCTSVTTSPSSNNALGTDQILKNYVINGIKVEAKRRKVSRDDIIREFVYPLEASFSTIRSYLSPEDINCSVSDPVLFLKLVLQVEKCDASSSIPAVQLKDLEARAFSEEVRRINMAIPKGIRRKNDLLSDGKPRQWIDTSDDTKKFKNSQYYVLPILRRRLTSGELEHLIGNLNRNTRLRSKSR